MPIKSTIIALLLFAAPAFGQTLTGRTLKQAVPSCATVNGNEASYCGCPNTLGPQNLTLLFHAVVDFCGASIVGTGAGSVGIDLTGSHGVTVRNFYSITGVDYGVLMSLTQNHVSLPDGTVYGGCQDREQGNNVVEKSQAISAAKYALVDEGSEQDTLRDNAWLQGGLAGGLFVGDTGGGAVPVQSPNVQVCPTGQTMTELLSENTTFVGPNGGPGVISMGDTSQFTMLVNYMVSAGNGPEAVLFEGPYAVDGTTGKTHYASDWQFQAFRNEKNAKDYSGTCLNCNILSNIELGPNGSGATVISFPTSTPIAVNTPTPASTPTPSSSMPSGFTLSSSGMYYTAQGQCACPSDRPICLIAVHGGATYCGPPGVY